MSETYNYKKGHPILAVVLGILGIAVALLLCLLTGVVGGAIAGVLGLAALVIGILGKKNGGKGIGGIIVGVLAILLAVIMTVTSIGTFQTLKEKAEQSGTAPLVAKYFDNPTLGLIGAAMKMPQDEGTLQELMDQFNSLK
ncbi:MAG: hypothetical protein IKG23_05160 [Clostridia bacterium]|nr:hypothetical protein [Clostridia bacterium]